MKTTMSKQVENYLKSIENKSERFNEFQDIIFRAVNSCATSYAEGLGILEHMKLSYKEIIENAVDESQINR